jgi:hypothetical protein
MTYYIGQQPNELLGDNPRYFYGLRRTDDGEIYFVKVDQLNINDSIEINNVGDDEENFNDFELGIDFFEGRDIDHEPVFDNLKYEQYRWDPRSLYYYIDDDGQLVVRINQKYTYPTGV